MFARYLSHLTICSGLFAFQVLQAQDDQATLARLMTELEDLNGQLQEYQTERDGIQRRLREQELELSDIHRSIFATDQSITRSQTELTRLESQAKQLATQKQLQETKLREELGAMYRSGTEEPLKMLLNQTNPADFSRMLTYYQYLLEARASGINTYLETLATVAATREGILQEQQRLGELRSVLATEEADLEAGLANRARLLEEIQARILSAEHLIAEKERDRDRLERLIADVEERIASLAPPESYKPFATLKGQYAWPSAGNLTYRYGSSRSGNMRWQGVVIGSAAGEPVHSIHYGRVVFADYLRGYGLLVIVDHDDDYLTLYGHNQSLFVEPGDWVTPGDQIALVGNSGGIPQDGLYFEIRHRGEPQNPAAWAAR